MSIGYKKFEKVAKRWVESISHYNEIPFQRKPNQKKWSVAQMYGHLNKVAFEDIIPIINDLEKKQKDYTKEGKTFKGKLAFFLGKPYFLKKEFDYEPKAPDNLMDAQDKMYRIMKRISELDSKIDGDSKAKIKHEIYGFLNAKDWLKLLIMHFEKLEKLKEEVNQTLKH